MHINNAIITKTCLPLDRFLIKGSRTSNGRGINRNKVKTTSADNNTNTIDHMDMIKRVWLFLNSVCNTKVLNQALHFEKLYYWYFMLFYLCLSLRIIFKLKCSKHVCWFIDCNKATKLRALISQHQWRILNA
jgi:hypothetical protein